MITAAKWRTVIYNVYSKRVCGEYQVKYVPCVRVIMTGRLFNELGESKLRHVIKNKIMNSITDPIEFQPVYFRKIKIA